MLINPTKPFRTKILGFRLAKQNKRFAKVNYRNKQKEVHIYEGQKLNIGDEIECIAERYDKMTILHQTRTYLFNSLYNKNQEYLFRVLYEKVDYSNFDPEYYLDVMDEKNRLYHRLYFDYEKSKNGFRFLSIIRGCHISCRVNRVVNDKLDITCNGIAIFKYEEIYSTPEYGKYQVNRDHIFDFIYDANIRLRCPNPLSYIVYINWGKWGKEYRLGEWISSSKNNASIDLINETLISSQTSHIGDSIKETVVDEQNNEFEEPINKISPLDTIDGVEKVSKEEKYRAEDFGVKTPERNKTRTARKIDFSQEQEEKSKTGNHGEEWVVRYEREKLLNAGLAELASKVEWVSKTKGDGLGYDIVSYDRDTHEKKYIEVKTTKGRCDSMFYISRNELQCSKDLSNYYLYRLYNYDPSTSEYDLLVIQGDLSELCTVPVSYGVQLDMNS